MNSRFKRSIVILLTVLMILPVFSISFSAVATEEDLKIEGDSGIIVNMDTDTILYTKNADAVLFCGFLPRLMTCILLVESKIPLDTVITVHSSTNSMTPQQSSAKINSGDTISLNDLLSAIILANSQEACVAVGLYLSDGNMSSFLEKMNIRARELGCKTTYFANCTGYYSASNMSYTTAKDAVKIVCHGLSLDFILEKSNSRYASLNINGKDRKIYTKNGLIDSESEYYYNKASGFFLHGDTKVGSSMASMIIDKKIHFVSVVISTKTISQTFLDIKKMLEFSLDEYQYRTLKKKNDVEVEVPVISGKEKDYVVLTIEDEISISIPRSTDLKIVLVDNAEKITDKDPETVYYYRVDVPEELQAPVEKGVVYGRLVFVYKGEEVKTVNLLSQSAVELDILAHYTKIISDFFTNKYVLATIFALIVIIIFYMILTHHINKKKQYKAKSANKERIKFR